MKEKPDEIVKMIKAILKGVDYIRNRKGEILAIMETKWGIKEADVRESIYRDIVGIYTRNGIASDETMKNVIQLVRDTRKSKDDKSGLVRHRRLDLCEQGPSGVEDSMTQSVLVVRESCPNLWQFTNTRPDRTRTTLRPSFLKNPSFSNSSSND